MPLNVAISPSSESVFAPRKRTVPKTKTANAAGTERIAAQVGKGNFANVNSSVCDPRDTQDKLTEVNGIATYLVSYASPKFTYLNTLPILSTTQKEIYYYHTDHLGSSAWITDSLGVVVQHLCYLPWGEPYVTQKTGNFNPTYTFSGKERDEETGYSYFGQRFYDSQLSFWLSVDPMRGKYPNMSPFVYCANNPVRLVDPNGMSITEFDEDGNYIRTIKDNKFHNRVFGHIGRIVNKEGKTVQNFFFADPANDYKDIKDGKLNKIVFVKETEITKMLSNAGAFDAKNKTYNNSDDNRYNYILKQGKGLGVLDFYSKGMPEMYGATIYNSLFLIDNTAHNPQNFGNFLFGAAGKSLGFYAIELLLGAHYNSLFNSETNGYKPQFDSWDDQKSIFLGTMHALYKNYKNKIVKQ